MLRTTLLALGLALGATPAPAQGAPVRSTQPAKTFITEASCGKCQFGMAGDDCALAVRINGKPYYVDGTNIDQHGDAHAANGFCNAVRRAVVSGEVVNGRFKATSFKLLPVRKKNVGKG